jgi:ABC-type lipoprotein export system ATPase subunit
VTHDPEVASRADRKIVLKDGMVVEDTLPFTAEQVSSTTPLNNEESNG